MKKIFIAMLALSLCFSTACFGGEETATEPSTTTSTVTETTVENSSAKESSNATEAQTETSVVTEETTKKATEKATEKTTETVIQQTTAAKNTGIIVKTKYYTVNLPDSWKGKYKEDIIDNKHIVLTHKKSEKLGVGGYLFSIELFENEEEYNIYPSYKLINTIKTDDGKVYDLVAVFPTDAQFSGETADEYVSLSKTTGDVINSLKLTKKAKPYKR